MRARIASVRQTVVGSYKDDDDYDYSDDDGYYCSTMDVTKLMADVMLAATVEAVTMLELGTS